MQPKILHSRRITIESEYIDAGILLIVGHLNDQCPNGFYSLLHSSPPGTLHDMHLEMEVRLTDFEIVAARAEMQRVPEEACREVLPGVQQLVGLRVTGGFTSAMRSRLGRARFCTHLGNLTLAMATATMQAVPTALQEAGLAERLDQLESQSYTTFVNSCHAWREGGPYATATQQKLGAPAGTLPVDEHS